MMPARTQAQTRLAPLVPRHRNRNRVTVRLNSEPLTLTASAVVEERFAL